MNRKTIPLATLAGCAISLAACAAQPAIVARPAPSMTDANCDQLVSRSDITMDTRTIAQSDLYIGNGRMGTLLCADDRNHFL